MDPRLIHIEFDQDDGATVHRVHRDTLRERFRTEEQEEPLGATCYDLSQFVAARLEEEGIVDSAEVFVCVTEGEAHYGVVVIIDDQKYVVDLGYNQPILIPVAVNGEPHVCDLYTADEDDSFKGPVTYVATEKEDGVIHLSVTSAGRSTEFPFQPLTDELAKENYRYWKGMTASKYSAQAMRTADGRVKMKKGPIGPAATEDLKEGDTRIHKIAKASRDKIRVIFVREFPLPEELPAA